MRKSNTSSSEDCAIHYSELGGCQLLNDMRGISRRENHILYYLTNLVIDVGEAVSLSERAISRSSEIEDAQAPSLYIRMENVS